LYILGILLDDASRIWKEPILVKGIELEIFKVTWIDKIGRTGIISVDSIRVFRASGLRLDDLPLNSCPRLWSEIVAERNPLL